MTVRVGALLALVTLLYGFGLGAAFGAKEDQIKDHLENNGRAVFSQVYHGDEAALEKIVGKSWSYFKRAHLHANGLGTAALAATLLLTLVAGAPAIKALAAGLFGFGALGYSSFWMFAGLKAPGLGSTHAAKEALTWLALPASGACIAGLLLVLYLLCTTVFLPSHD